MLLRTRFIVLIALVSVSVAGVLASVSWSAWLLKRDVSDQFAATMSLLNDTKIVGATVSAVRTSLDTDLASAERTFEPRIAGLRLQVERLVHTPGVATRMGVVSAGTLRTMVDEIERAGLRWMETGDDASRTTAVEEVLDLSILLRQLEVRALDDSRVAIDAGLRIGRSLVLVTVFVFLTVLLTGLLAIALFQRWVTRPVARLRGATEQIGRGDFSVRLTPAGHDELSDLADAVNRMASTIEHMQNERVQRERLAAVGELLRRLSHNLRNPLAGIRGVAEVSRRRAGADERQRDDMDRIIRSVDRLDEWLSDLLSSTSPMEVRPTAQNVREWLSRLIDAHRPTAQTKSVALRMETDSAPEEAYFDRRHLDQAVTALVTNAIQATPAAGSVVVAVRAVDNGAWWEVEVRDTGPGVGERDREHVFNAHFTTKPDGTGLGLSVARQVAHRHGGEIELRASGRSMGGESSGTGAVFVIRLPLRGVATGEKGTLNGAQRAAEDSGRRG